MEEPRANNPSIPERVRIAGDEIRGEELPTDWTPEQWVTALACKLGEAAYHAGSFRDCIRQVFPGAAAEHLEQFNHMMVAIAAIAQHAVEAMEQAGE